MSLKQFYATICNYVLSSYRPFFRDRLDLVEMETSVVEKRTVKKGTSEWWTTIAMLRIARRQRRLEEITEENPVTFSVEEINAELAYLNRHPFKRIWILLINGDMTERIVETAFGKEIRLKPMRE